MNSKRSFCRLAFSLLALLFLLTACGGSGGAGSNSTTPSAGTQTQTPQSTAGPQSSNKSTISFTATGDFTGSYTLSDTNTMSNYKPTFLNLTVETSDWLMNLSVTPYHGPGTYTLKPTQEGDISLTSITQGSTSKRWQILAPATCSLTITGDQASKDANGQERYHQITGTFASCTLQNAQTTTSLKLSNGQFTIVSLVIPGA